MSAGCTPVPTSSTDPITLEVIRHGLVAAAEQMADSIERSAHSQVIREMLDYSTAVFDQDGQIVAQATRIPIHLNSMSRALQTILSDHYPLEEWRPGDVFVSNDPYAGGQHLPDVQTFAPVFHGDTCIGIVGTLGHQLDVGGRGQASYGSDATEIFHEGFRIPPCRIATDGEISDLFLRLWGANIRVPHKTIGDLRSQIAALVVGRTEVLRLADKYGADTLQGATTELTAASEQRMRAAIGALPTGVFTAEDTVDGDGIDDEPLPLHVAVSRDADELVVDLTGSAEQVRGPINCPIAPTEAAVYYAVQAILDPGAVPNHGTYRPIRVIAPAGTVVNPRFPAPVVGRNVFTHRIASTVMAALGQALPDRVVAPHYGSSNVFALSAPQQDGSTNLLLEIEIGGWGARAGKDGPDALSAGIQNLNNLPIELVENEFPLRMIRYGLREGSGGLGQYRGGLGLERSFEVLADCELGTQFDRVRFAVPGMNGGEDGAPARVLVEHDGTTTQLPGKCLGYPLHRGDRVRVLTQGGGGLGNPGDRKPEAIRRDVRQQKVTKKQLTDAGIDVEALA